MRPNLSHTGSRWVRWVIVVIVVIVVSAFEGEQ